MHVLSLLSCINQLDIYLLRTRYSPPFFFFFWSNSTILLWYQVVTLQYATYRQMLQFTSKRNEYQRILQCEVQKKKYCNVIFHLFIWIIQVDKSETENDLLSITHLQQFSSKYPIFRYVSLLVTGQKIVTSNTLSTTTYEK